MTKDEFQIFRIIDDFLDNTEYDWSHDDWLNLISEVEDSGFNINAEELGVMLENQKQKFHKNKLLRESEVKLHGKISDIEFALHTLMQEKESMEKHVEELYKEKDRIEKWFIGVEKEFATFENKRNAHKDDERRLEEEKKIIEETKKIMGEERKLIEETEQKIYDDFKKASQESMVNLDKRSELENMNGMLKQKQDRLFHLEKQIDDRINKLDKKEKTLDKFEKILEKKEKKFNAKGRKEDEKRDLPSF